MATKNTPDGIYPSAVAHQATADTMFAARQQSFLLRSRAASWSGFHELARRVLSRGEGPMSGDGVSLQTPRPTVRIVALWCAFLMSRIGRWVAYLNIQSVPRGCHVLDLKVMK